MPAAALGAYKSCAACGSCPRLCPPIPPADCTCTNSHDVAHACMPQHGRGTSASPQHNDPRPQRSAEGVRPCKQQLQQQCPTPTSSSSCPSLHHARQGRTDVRAGRQGAQARNLPPPPAQPPAHPPTHRGRAAPDAGHALHPLQLAARGHAAQPLLNSGCADRGPGPLPAPRLIGRGVLELPGAIGGRTGRGTHMHVTVRHAACGIITPRTHAFLYACTCACMYACIQPRTRWGRLGASGPHHHFYVWLEGCPTPA